MVVMGLRGRYGDDGSLAGVCLQGGVFPSEVEWDEDIFDVADERFLRRDGDEITVHVDEGTAKYRVTARLSDPVMGAMLEAVLTEVDPA